MTAVPHVKARITDSRMPAMIASARVELMYRPISASETDSLEVMTTIETASAEPSRQKIRATEVEVGSPKVL